MSVSEGAGHRIQSIDILLGNGAYYDIYISGSVSVAVVYENDALLTGQEFIVNGVGDLQFTFTEDVVFSDSGLAVTTSTDIDLILDIDLPTDLNGRLEVPSGITFSYSSMVGWSLASSGMGLPSVYTTIAIDQPLLDIEHNSLGSVSGSLQG